MAILKKYDKKGTALTKIFDYIITKKEKRKKKLHIYTFYPNFCGKKQIKNKIYKRKRKDDVIIKKNSAGSGSVNLDFNLFSNDDLVKFGSNMSKQ